MRNYVFGLLLITSCMFLLTNCKKSTNDNMPAATSDYSPLTTGSNWTYKFNDGSSTDTFTLTVTGKDTMANGKNYKVLSSSDGTGNSYLAKVGNDYYHFLSFPSVGINNVEDYYLKDNADVNASWSDSANFNYTGFPVTLSATLKHTLVEKGITRVVNGVTFTNVLHVRLDVTVTFVGAIQGGDFYYAKDVGLIESTLALSGTGIPDYNASETILSYQKK